MDRKQLSAQLAEYSRSNPKESLFVAQFNSLLKQSRCFFRDYFPGHITGSAWITNSNHSKVLLVHHAKLGKWLQPGGHADGDENVFEVAKKELLEETGISHASANRNIFDIDIHKIPEQKDIQEHFHYDIRFLFIADEFQPLRINHESHEARWIRLSELEQYNKEKSMIRMKQKLLHRHAIWN